MSFGVCKVAKDLKELKNKLFAITSRLDNLERQRTYGEKLSSDLKEKMEKANKECNDFLKMHDIDIPTPKVRKPSSKKKKSEYENIDRIYELSKFSPKERGISPDISVDALFSFYCEYRKKNSISFRDQAIIEKFIKDFRDGT